MKTLLLLIIAAAVVYIGFTVYTDRAEAEANKDEPIMCIVGASDNC